MERVTTAVVLLISAVLVASGLLTIHMTLKIGSQSWGIGVDTVEAVFFILGSFLTGLGLAVGGYQLRCILGLARPPDNHKPPE